MAGGREVVDGQATVAQTYPAATLNIMFPVTYVVRTAMGLDSGHPDEHFVVSAIHQASNATHAQ